MSASEMARHVQVGILSKFNGSVVFLQCIGMEPGQVQGSCEYQWPSKWVANANV